MKNQNQFAILFKSIAIISLLFASLFIQAAPVFEVSKKGDKLYIGGTFHILTAQDFPLQTPFYDVYEKVDTLYFETDIENSESPAFMAMIMPVMMYQDGTTIDKVIKPETFKKLKNYFASKGTSVNNFINFTPTGLMSTITILEYQARGFTLAGVDQHMFEKGKQDNKAIKWFESLEQQVSFLDSFDADDPNALLNYLFDSMGSLDSLVEALHSSWRKGDMDTLASIGLKEFADYPEMYDVLIKKRNDDWMKTIETLFDNESTEFVLVGALHLPGKDGLLTQLEQKGYTVKQLK